MSKLSILKKSNEIAASNKTKPTREKLQEVWDLVHSKYPENNEEIQKVRFAVKVAMDLAEKDTPETPIGIQREFGDLVASCPNCELPIVNVWSNTEFKPNYCHFCGQRLEWSKSKDD